MPLLFFFLAIHPSSCKDLTNDFFSFVFILIVGYGNFGQLIKFLFVDAMLSIEFAQFIQFIGKIKTSFVFEMLCLQLMYLIIILQLYIFFNYSYFQTSCFP